MSNHNAEIERITTEWRSLIIKRLDSQDEKLDKLRESQVQLMLSSSTSKALGELEARVRKLEKFQIQAMTVIAVTQIVVAIVWALLVKFVFK